ncbi:MAG: hypothetical protein IPI38_00965 [Gemmatimonadetes bacterium]|nr:hypothetical protein [Gemmatimonadota bacterium]
MRPALLLLAILLPGCAASSASPATPEPAPTPAAARPLSSFVVKVTSGAREGVEVDWAIFPDESWPLEGRRDRTPFQLDLPQGRVAAIVRPTGRNRLLEVSLYRRLRDGSLERLQPPSGPHPIAVVVSEPGDSVPRILAPDDAASSARP